MVKKINLNHKLVVGSFWLSILFIFLIIIRVFTQFNVLWVWLIWNLFLAWLALVLIYITPKKLNLITYLSYIVALLFFPNILYLITDLIHFRLIILRNYSNFQLDVLDTILLILLACIGMIMHVVVLHKHHIFWLNRAPKKYHGMILPCLILLLSYGLYLGRVSRLNSWDTFSRPSLLLHKIFNSILDYRMYLFIIIISLFIYLIQKYYETRFKKCSS